MLKNVIKNIIYNFNCYYLLIYLIIFNNLLINLLNYLCFNIFHIQKTILILIILTLIYLIISCVFVTIFYKIENSSKIKKIKLINTKIIKQLNIELVKVKNTNLFTNEKHLILNIIIISDDGKKNIMLYEKYSSKLILDIIIFLNYKTTFKKLTINNILDLFKRDLSSVEDIFREDLKSSILLNDRKRKLKKLIKIDI